LRQIPLRYIDPTGQVLTISGDVDEAQKQLCGILGANDCGQRISFNHDTNTITVDLTGIDPSKNEGASLLGQLVESSNVYNLTLGSEFLTAGGLKGLTDATPNENLDNRDTRLGHPTPFNRPPNGVDDVVAIDPSRARFHDSSGRPVSLSSLIFHELAEAYAKVDLGRRYADADTLSVRGGAVVTGIGGYQGAHFNAVDREITLRIQRPNLQLSGRAGDVLIRDPK
jgi:hypothetical protein